MATEANKPADRGEYAVMPAALLGCVSEYMIELRGRIIQAAYRNAGKRGTKKRPSRATHDDVLGQARPLLATAFRELEHRLHELTLDHVQRQAS
jgi:hypothetical protein